MNILFLDAYFEPEQIAYTHLEKDILEFLTSNGNEVTIICPIPTRNISKDIAKKYKKIKNEMLYDGKVFVKRFWAPQEGKNPLLRAFRYIWCNIKTYQLAKKGKEVDVVFTNSTPPTQGLIGAKVAKKLSRKLKRYVPFIYNLQDIFPDSLVNAKMTQKGSLLWKLGHKLEMYTYASAEKIVVISEGFKRNIINKGVLEEKIVVVSNWVDLEMVRPVLREDNKLIEEFGLDRNKFMVVYAGNFGAAQGADIVLKVAKKMIPLEDIQFVIFGGGPLFQEAQKEVSEEKLSNVKIYDLLPAERVSEVYSLGDVALITCKTGTGNAGLPSKTWNIMACNTPIIASFDLDSDLADVIEASNAGCCVTPENVESLESAIYDMYSMKSQYAHNGYQLREYALKNASKDVCVKKFVGVMLGN